MILPPPYHVDMLLHERHIGRDGAVIPRPFARQHRIEDSSNGKKIIGFVHFLGGQQIGVRIVGIDFLKTLCLIGYLPGRSTLASVLQIEEFRRIGASGSDLQKDILRRYIQMVNPMTMEMLNGFDQRQGYRLRFTLRQLALLLYILREEFAAEILGHQIYDIGCSCFFPSGTHKVRQIIAET